MQKALGGADRKQLREPRLILPVIKKLWTAVAERQATIQEALCSPGAKASAPHWNVHAASSRHSKEQQRWKGRMEGGQEASVGRQQGEKLRRWMGEGAGGRLFGGAAGGDWESEASGAQAMVHDGSVVDRKSLQHSSILSRGNCGGLKDASQEEKVFKGSSRLK